MAGPIVVEGPDGQKYEFPEGTAPDVMKSAMAKRYPKPVAAAPKPYEWDEAAAIEGGKFGASQPPTEAEMAGWATAKPPKMGRGQSGMLGILDVARNMGGFVDTVGEVIPPAAGPIKNFKAASGGQGPAEMGFKALVDAPTKLVMKSIGQDTDADTEAERLMTQSLKDNPVSTRLGQGVGMMAGGGAQLWNRGEKAITTLGGPMAKALGIDKPGKINAGLRYAGRLAGLGALGSADYAAYNAGFEGENQTRETGEKVSGYDIAVDELDNPLAWGAAPLASIIFRAGRAAVTGQATPSAVKMRVDAALSPTNKAGEVLPAEVLGTVDPRAEKLLIRMLARAGFSKDDITGAIAAFERSAEGDVEVAALPSRLKDVLIEQLGDDAAEPVQRFLQGAGVSAGTAASGRVRSAVTEDYGRLADFLHDSANSRLGSKSRYATLTEAEQEMERLGKEAYERIFSQGPTSRADMDELGRVLEFYAGSDLNKPLKQVAAGKMLNVEEMIKKDPRRAAHLLQRAANMAAQDAFDRNDKILGNAYTEMRDNILTRLEKPGVAPTYQEARKRFGDEFGTEQALRFGARFFTKTQDTLGTQQLAKEFGNLTEAQQDAARMSVRDETLRIAGRGREGAAPRLTQLESESALSGLETVLGKEGGQFANDIRYTGDRLRRTRDIDPSQNSRTVENSVARQFADEVASNPMAHALGVILKKVGGDAAASAAVSTATGNPAMLPILTARTALRNMGDSFARGRQGKIDDLTELLLQDMQKTAPRPGMPGDGAPTIPPRDGGAKPAAPFAEVMSKGGTVSKDAPKTRAQGLPALQNDLMSGLLYSGVGAFSGNFVDYNQDGVTDEKDMAVGAGVGAAGGAGASRLGRNMPIPKGKGTRWEADDVQGFVDRVITDTKPKPIERAATEADFDEAMTEAMDLLRRFQTSKGKDLDIQNVQDKSTLEPDARPIMAVEELAAQILRGRGIDPDPYLMPQVAQRPTNRETEEIRAAFRSTKGSAIESEAARSKKPVSELVGPPERPATAAEYQEAYKEARQKLTRRRGRGIASREDVEKLALEILLGMRLDGSAFRVAGTDAGENVIALRPGNSSDPKQFGAGSDIASSAVGAAVGTAGGSQRDLNEDGEIDEEDALIGGAVGAAGAPIASRLVKGKSPDTKAMGASGRKPPPDDPEIEAIRAAVKEIRDELMGKAAGTERQATEIRDAVREIAGPGGAEGPRRIPRGTIEAPARMRPQQEAQPAAPPTPRGRIPTEGLSPLEMALMGGTGGAAAATASWEARNRKRKRMSEEELMTELLLEEMAASGR